MTAEGFKSIIDVPPEYITIATKCYVSRWKTGKIPNPTVKVGYGSPHEVDFYFHVRRRKK